MNDIQNAKRSEYNHNKPDQSIIAEVIGKIGEKLNSPIETTALLELFLQQVNQIIHFSTANVFLIENYQAKLHYTLNNEAYDTSDKTHIHLNESDINQIPSVKEILQRGEPFYFDPSPTGGPWVGIPVTSLGEVVGLITLSDLRLENNPTNPLEYISSIASLVSSKLEIEHLSLGLQARDEREENARARIVQSEKLAALGRIVASVAHELNNPLQAIQNALYLISQEDNLTPQSREDIQVALTESNRMAGLIARLRETYRPMSTEEFQFCSINNLVLDVEKLIATHLRHNNVKFNFHPETELPQCLIIQDQMKQVILNICLNAVESMHRGGHLEVRTMVEANKNRIDVIFTDNGPGIAPEILPNIFDPFITTKEGGTGLGLSITYDIVHRHGGTIEVESQLGKGTKFIVSIPVSH